ncbi:hypothetical protein QQS21_007354 [Conoideocrella luteorostrata]|uniref:CN hydrolase domain-containing protein n=1 Tax=Conoideocrella luteorostrata TaxID=1105319 RepID=A0AAJ0CQ62_9HYPO|nr:hypothetical protein QQS21_007354 [Conoideocrella luteorostrata]
MRIACLQFAPQVGDVDNNLNRADAILSRADPEALDLLVLPELAFSGYNFKSLRQISQFLEPSGSGISSLWSRTTALKYDCTVVAGYPERVDPALKWPTNPEYYNAAIVVNGEGETVANYRKSHLYYTDETWALEGPAGFFYGNLEGLGRTAMGICMDLNPHRFEAPWEDFEFAHHVLDCGARLVVLSMAWITNDDPRQFSRMPQEPDMDTLHYWISRLEPIIRAESTEEVIIVFANRTGSEGEAMYAGTSAVIGIQSGEVRVYGILGRGDKEVLVVDTDSAPYAKLVCCPTNFEMNAEAAPILDPERQQRERGIRTDSSQLCIDSRNTPRSAKEAVDMKSSRRVPGLPKYRRNDLFVEVHSDPEVTHSPESLAIHTPTAPSPTPHSIRPRLPVSTNHHNSHGYLNAPSPGSVDAAAAGSRPFRILGGDVRFHRSNANPSVSPSHASESRFSESSFESSQLYWIPTFQSPMAALGSRLTRPDDADEITSNGSALAGNENCHSARSDVSVWNDHPGKPPRNSSQPPLAPRSSSQDAQYDTSQNRQFRAQSAIENPTDAYPDHASLPKSGNGGRSRSFERSNSKPARTADLGAVCQSLEDTAMYTTSTHDRTSSVHTNRDGSRSISRKQAPRSQSRGRKPTPTPIFHDQSHGRSISAASIPIFLGADVGTLVNSAHQVGPELMRRSNAPFNEPPILRPASRSHLGSRSNSKQGRISDRPQPRSAFMQREIRSNTPAKLEDRSISRGRQREVNQSTSHQIPHGSRPSRSSQHSSHERPRRATSGHGPPPEPIDLSQFNLIEEHPAPNCPIHGSRPSSGKRDRTKSGSGPSTTTTNRLPSNPQRPQRRSSHNTPRSASRRETTRSAASRTPLVQASPKPKTSTTSKLHNHLRDSSDIVETNVSPGPLTLKRGGDPKTPVAMMLVYDGKDSPQEPTEPATVLRCVERRLGNSIRRSKSAIW